MTCLRPIVIDNPRFNPKELINERNRPKINVPCGKCEFCLSNKRQQWSFRLNAEANYARSAFFVTLTYNDAHLPKDGIANKRDVQNFFKRFRKSIPDYKIKYFLVSEYGETYGRVHYHMLLFNYPYDREILRKHLKRSWQLSDPEMFDTQRSGEPIGNVTPASIGYVCKYCLSTLQNGNGLKNFMLCSKGLGLDYLTDTTIDYLRTHLDGIGVVNQIRTSLPRYYAEKVYDDEMKSIINEKKQNYHEIAMEKYCKTNYSCLNGRPLSLWCQEQRQKQSRIRKSIKNGFNI